MLIAKLVEFMPTIGPLEYDVDVDTDVPIVTTAETVVATLSGVTLMADAQRVFLFGHVKLTTGTATTTVTPRFRRGSLTGTLIGEAVPISIASAAGGTDVYEHCAVWTPGEVANESVVFTLTQAAATGNGSALDIVVFALAGH